ncbi:sugar transferase [Chryseobacterium hagamense]|uniref:Glycosyl transferase n=1 Tax=Chryseobacterium hagamense TaxID=395935 RepID=A0A511YLT6_9FLAO|nr:sugar transferase [Chryseobacterium hagamense]GEN76159.1 glycosyl transferase [Chryseobacterium hagamense]
MKRLFDIISSSTGLIILSPIFLFLAIWIKFDSQGPVFYRQVRVGKKGKDFRIFKFRSMHQGSDKKGLITIGGKDPRVTKSGYFIRKYKLDEFPQLINVLVGDMSIVGPRPEVRKYVNLYTKEQLKVLSVKPGITDTASIKYRNENEMLENAENPNKMYMEVIMPDKLKYNLEYINNQSFLYDLKLIFLTIKEIIVK